MAKTISSLSVVLGATVAPLVSAFQSATAATESLKSSVGSVGGSMLALTGAGALLAGGMAAIRGVFGSLSDSISLASQLEQNAVAFETMTGSAAVAKTLMEQLSAFAAETPFEFPELATSAKQLLAFGVSVDQIVPSLKMLGDIAAGVGAPIGELAAAYGKVRTAGRLTGETLMQFNNKGIPLLSTLAKQMGVTTAEITKMIEQGKIGFPQVQKALGSLTGPGGQFAGMMEKQSHTLGGLWSTLTDNISLSMAGMVQSIVDAFHLKDALVGLITFTGTAGDFLKGMVGRIAPIVMSAGSAIVGVVGPIFQDMYAVAVPVVTGLANFIAGAWGGIRSTAVSAFTAVYDVVTGVLQSAFSFIAPIVAGIVQVVADSWVSVVGTAIGYAQSLFNVWSGVYIAAWEIIKTAASGITVAWTWAMDTLGLSTMNAKSVTEGAFGGIVKAVQWFYENVTLGLNIVAFGLRNFQDVIASVMLSSAHEVVKFSNQVTYFFADVIPGYLSWFGRNWTQIFTDIATFTGTVFVNMAANVGNFFLALWDAMKGDGFDFKWTGLTDGFKATLSELPSIAERQVGPLEQTLGDAADSMTNELSKGLGQYLVDQDKKTKAVADAIKGTVDDIGKSIHDAMKPADLAGAIKPPAMPNTKFNLDTSGANAALDATKAKAEDLKTVFAGSAEAGQLQAQAVFAARMTTPAIPAPTPAGVNELAARGTPDNSIWQQQIVPLLAQIAGAGKETAKNTGKPQIAQGTLN